MSVEHEHPEHEKLERIASKSQVIGEFLDWLRGGGLADYGPISLMYRCEATTPALLDEDGEVLFVEQTNTRYLGVHHVIQEILAAYFEIDLAALEAEKRAMLKAVRNAVSS